MRAAVVYESMWGNTAEVARAVARGLGTAVVKEVHDMTPDDLGGVDFLVVGGPTHAFSMSRPSTREDAHRQGAATGAQDRGIREWLQELPDRIEIPVATFDTRVAKARRLPGSAAKSAAKELRRHHHSQVCSHESFFVEDTAGPLVVGEVDRAVAWGEAIRATSPA